MDVNKTLKCAGVLAVLSLCGAVMPANADARVFTASIDREGKVLAQSPDWIAEVAHSSQPDYFAEYNVKVVPGSFNSAPDFCTVASTDVSTYDHLLYGHVKLGAAPAADAVKVLALHVGNNGSSGDTSLGFMLMCVKQ